MQYGCYSGATDALLPEIPAQPDHLGHLFWPFRDLDGAVCLNREVKWIFLGMLLMLQVLSMIWFGMIINVIVSILRGGSAEDTRSDGEEEDDDEEIDIQVYDERVRKGRPMNVTDLNVCVDGGSSATGSNRRIGALSPKPTTVTRRSLLDGEKRKELLARIGCDKPVGG
jgi:very-long-chain ceramide synthase